MNDGFSSHIWSPVHIQDIPVLWAAKSFRCSWRDSKWCFWCDCREAGAFLVGESLQRLSDLADRPSRVIAIPWSSWERRRINMAIMIQRHLALYMKLVVHKTPYSTKLSESILRRTSIWLMILAVMVFPTILRGNSASSSPAVFYRKVLQGRDVNVVMTS